MLWIFSKMSLTTIVTVAQIAISILLGTLILLQQRGGGLSSVFGQDGAFYRTRRGLEKHIFWATVVLAALFFGAAIVNIFLG